MNNELTDKYVQCLVRFRKAYVLSHKPMNMTLTELLAMLMITENAREGDKTVDLSQIQRVTHVTKAAVSQMLASLERKGYLIRGTDRTNRRRITVELTSDGFEAFEEAKNHFVEGLELIFKCFGEEKALALISLLDELADVLESIERETESNPNANLQ